MVIATNACPTGDERVTLFGLLLEVNARLSREFAVALEARCALPLAWFEVLLQLRRADEGRLKMSEIADAIVHSTGGTTRLIDRLEEAQLVVRQNCPSDRRAIHVAITDEGHATFDRAMAVHLDFLDDTLAARLDRDERTALSELLTRLL